MPSRHLSTMICSCYPSNAIQGHTLMLLEVIYSCCQGHLYMVSKITSLMLSKVICSCYLYHVRMLSKVICPPTQGHLSMYPRQCVGAIQDHSWMLFKVITKSLSPVCKLYLSLDSFCLFALPWVKSTPALSSFCLLAPDKLATRSS